jgi:ketosteroid isomerase-like protein
MAEVPAAIQRFLDGIQTGDWEGMEDYLTPDVLYDATVPGWRYQYEGAERVVEDYREEWTGKHPWRIIELHVTPTPEGAVVDFEARGQCPGNAEHAPHEEGSRLANIFRLEDGRIAEHRYYCAGEFSEEDLRRIEQEAPMVRR